MVMDGGDDQPWEKGLVDVLPGGVDDTKALPTVSEAL